MSAAAKRTPLVWLTVFALAAFALVGGSAAAPPDKDRAAPTTPENLRVTAATATTVTLAWDPSQDDSGVVGYYVYGDKGKATVDRNLDKPQYTVDGLACGQSVQLSVVAFDASQNRSERATATASASPCLDMQPPSVPSGFTQAATSQDAVVLVWNASSDNVGVVGYDVYRNLQRVTSPTDPAATLSGLSCGSSYDYTVDAVDAAGNRSPFAMTYVRTSACPTSPSSTTDTQAPSVPSGLAASSIAQTSLTLSWTASSDNVGVTGYDVYRNGTKVAAPTSTSTSLSSLTCATSYAFAVQARDAAGNVSSQAKLSVSTATCSTSPSSTTDTQAPSVPSGLAASSITQTSLTLSWNAATDNVGVTAYDVYRNGTNVASVATTSSAQSGLACGTAYTFAVVARDAASNSSSQATLTASTSACTTQSSGDTTPPTAPTGLAASGVTQTGLTLSWNVATDNVGVTGYDVFRNGTRVASGIAATSTSQSGLSCGTSYPFGVVARDAAGNSSSQVQLTIATSACAEAPTPTDTTPPSQPGNLAIASATASSVALTWSASTDAVGVEGYRVYVNGAYANATSGIGATVSGLTCGTTYTFDVDAFDAEGNTSRRASVTGSTAACADTSAPTAPANVTATSRTATSIALSWSAATDNVGVAGYGLYRGGYSTGATPTTTAIFSGLACNTNYTLAVDAYDAAGNRSSPTVVMVSTTTCPDTAPPSAPTGLAAFNVGQTGLTLAWNASSDNLAVTGYDVYRSGTKVATVTSTSSSQSGLTCATSYTFGVVARDAAGNSSGTSQLNVSTAACPAATPSSSAYVADFETGDFSQVVNQQETTPDRITLTTSNPLQGAYTALATVGPNDYVAGGIRAEVTLPTFSSLFGGASLEGKQTWVTWEQKLDPNFEVAGWAITTQFHGGTGSPVFAIEADGPSPGQLVAVVRGGPVNGNYRTQVLADPVPLGTRLQFKVYHRWSTGSGGRVQVWLNGVLKATIDGPNLYTGYENAPYQKAGIYRGGVTPTRDSQTWTDNVRWWLSDPG